MKRFALVLLALSGVAGAGIWFLASRPVAAPAPSALATPRPQRPPQEVTFIAPAPSAQPAAGANEPAPVSGPPPRTLIADISLATQRIHALATTFDAAHAPELASYLQHASRDIRQKAAEGLMLLGDASAVAALKTAATLAEAQQDAGLAAACQAAADFLSQPKTGEPLPPPTPLHVTEQATAQMWREKTLKPAPQPVSAPPSSPID